MAKHISFTNHGAQDLEGCFWSDREICNYPSLLFHVGAMARTITYTVYTNTYIMTKVILFKR